MDLITHTTVSNETEKAIYPFRSTLSLLNYHRCIAFVWIGMYVDVDGLKNKSLTRSELIIIHN